jgi:Leu/Phe-tRNA-protein transferase
VTSHLSRFGCISIPAAEYVVKLKAAIVKPRRFYPDGESK